MSYDISFCVKVEGLDYYVSVGTCEANITYNVKQLILETSGWNMENGVGELLTNLIPKISLGSDELRKFPVKYKHLESPNGWGTMAGVKRFYKDILKSYDEFCADYPELVGIARVRVY